MNLKLEDWKLKISVYTGPRCVSDVQDDRSFMVWDPIALPGICSVRVLSVPISQRSSYWLPGYLFPICSSLAQYPMRLLMLKNSTVWRAGLMCASMPSFAGSLDCCETRDLWKNVRNALLDRTHRHTPTQLLWHCITNFYTNVFRLLNTLSCSWSPGIKAIVCPHYYNRILCYD